MMEVLKSELGRVEQIKYEDVEQNYSDKSQGIRKSQSKKFEDVQRKNMFSQFVSEHHL